MDNSPTDKIGFSLLDEGKWLSRFAQALRRVGYTLGDWRPPVRLISELRIPLLPLGRGERLVLRLEQDPGQAWCGASLLNEADPSNELGYLDFNATRLYRGKREEVWIEEIAALARDTVRAERDQPGHQGDGSVRA